MEEKYVISIKKKVNNHYEWEYAGKSADSYPCWYISYYSCKYFDSVEKAEQWFREVKKFLCGIYFKEDEYDIGSLGIRKVIYKKIKSLSI